MVGCDDGIHHLLLLHTNMYIFTREDALAGLVIEILHQQKFKVHVKMKISLDVDIKSHKYQIGFTKAIYLQTNS